MSERVIWVVVAIVAIMAMSWLATNIEIIVVGGDAVPNMRAASIIAAAVALGAMAAVAYDKVTDWAAHRR